MGPFGASLSNNNNNYASEQQHQSSYPLPVITMAAAGARQAARPERARDGAQRLRDCETEAQRKRPKERETEAQRKRPKETDPIDGQIERRMRWRKRNVSKLRETLSYFICRATTWRLFTRCLLTNYLVCVCPCTSTGIYLFIWLLLLDIYIKIGRLNSVDEISICLSELRAIPSAVAYC